MLLASVDTQPRREVAAENKKFVFQLNIKRLLRYPALTDLFC